MNTNDFLFNFSALGPEIILSVGICAVLLADMFVPLSKSRKVTGLAALIALAAALLLVGVHPGSQNGFYFKALVLNDRLSALFKLFLISGTALSILIGMGSSELAKQRFAEFAALTMGICLGGCLLSSSNNVILLLVALETVSLCAYALAGFAKHDRASAEASLKYVLYGAVASGIMLFGFGYLYGLTGTLELSPAIAELAKTSAHSVLTGGLVIALIGAGVAFKLAAVPFQFWAPDVYQGSPTPVTAFLSVVSKGAGFAVLVRLLAPAMQTLDTPPLSFQLFLGLMAVLSMTFGNLAAIRQTDVKRMLAYSSIAHAGYMLMALAVFKTSSVEAVLIYLFIYMFMNLGAFWVTVLAANKRGGTSLEQFKGAAALSPTTFIVMFLCLVALTGLPPTAGFVGKFALFKEVIGAALGAIGANRELTGAAVLFIALAVIGVLNSVVSLFYYMKIARAMAFEKLEGEAVNFEISALERTYAVALGVPLILLLNFGPLFSMVSELLKPASSFFL